ncbi:hypothetical protein [Parvibaculum sp.]|uniref:hypothetical protein n=1 Tax=Parvibaculum sp. TaxID=2024848 RepID=UPI002D7F12DA|nr:hypothetical protein [Parvibaculum sp.]
MTEMNINRIGSSSQPSSTGRQAQPHVEAQTTALAQVEMPVRTRPTWNGTSQSYRPVTGFLAQYVDQHMFRPRSAPRKSERRQRATRAYIHADMLPDLLAETLRLRTVDKRF